MPEEIEGGLPTPDPAVESTPPQPDPDVSFTFEEMAAPTPAPAPAPPQYQYFAPAPAPAPAPVPTQDQNVMLEQIANQFNEDMRTDPGKALTKAMLYGAQMGAQAARKQAEGDKADHNRQAIENFKAKMAAANPQIYKAVATDFEKQLEKATPEYLAQVSTSQLLDSLSVEYDAAKGRALDRVLAKPKTAAPAPAPASAQPRESVPSYGGGQTAAPGPTTIKVTTAAQQEFVDMARIADLTDDEIADMML